MVCEEGKMGELAVEKEIIFRKIIEKNERYICSILSLNLVNGSVTGFWLTNEGCVCIEGWCLKRR